MKNLLLAAALLAGVSAAAFAATGNFSLVFSGPASTSVTCTPAAASFTVPVAAGTLVANCAVLPASWAGSFSIGGTGAASFFVGGTAPNFTVSVGSSAYNTVGTLNLTATSAP